MSGRISTVDVPDYWRASAESLPLALKTSEEQGELVMTLTWINAHPGPVRDTRRINLVTLSPPRLTKMLISSS